jgi:hypothetical protein
MFNGSNRLHIPLLKLLVHKLIGVLKTSGIMVQINYRSDDTKYSSINILEIRTTWYDAANKLEFANT